MPILCVGEQLAEREAERTHEVVARQLDAVLELCRHRRFAQAVLAYEPVWAIGTGRNATPEQAQDVHAFIRARLASRDAKIAGQTRDSLRRQRQGRQCGRAVRHAGRRRRADRRGVAQGRRVSAHLERCRARIKMDVRMLHMILTMVQVFSSAAIIGAGAAAARQGRGCGAGFGAGASGTVFGARGARTALSRATAMFAAIFMINSLALAYMGTRKARGKRAQSTILDEAAPRNAPRSRVPGRAATGSRRPAPAQPGARAADAAQTLH